MGVVAPLSAVGAALVPVAVGVLTGERPAPLTWIGIVCAIPAIWLVSSAAAIRPGMEPSIAWVRESSMASWPASDSA